MFTIDAHLDLATNAMSLNRDLKKSAHQIRDFEIQLGMNDTQDRGKGTVALPDLRRGNIGLVLATMIARHSPKGEQIRNLKLNGWHSPEQAYGFAMAQLGWYRVMEKQGEMVQITTKAALDKHLQLWNDTTVSNDAKPIGYILSLEGADSIVDLDFLDMYYQEGLRAIGPAHFGPGRYSPGTHSDGTGLTDLGKQLLPKMESLSMALDATHLTDTAFFEAMDIFNGVVWASHQNCRAIVPGERQFSDEQLKLIIQKGGVIGGPLDAWMLYPDYKLTGNEDSKELGINLEKLVDHWDHICQMAGNSLHIGFGTDLDGLFGLEQSPYDLDTIADISKYQDILQRRGYTDTDIQNIFHANWLRVFNKVLS
ncbi:MAG: dipeptidase [Leadbetterella sp.]